MAMRTIAAPVTRLAEFAHRVEDGDYAAPPPAQRDDEIGRLADAFGLMTEAIASREAEWARQTDRNLATARAWLAQAREQLAAATGASVERRDTP